MKPLELGISLKSGRPPKKATLVYIGNKASVNRRTLEPQRANCARFLLGLENTDEQTLELIRKGALTATDREAIGLTRRHGILSTANWVVGFARATTARPKVPMHRIGADCPVVATKRGNARGAKGRVIAIGSGQPATGGTR